MFIVSTAVGTGRLLFIIWLRCHISVTNLSITALTNSSGKLERNRDIPLCQESNLFKVQCLPDILHTLLTGTLHYKSPYFYGKYDICWNLLIVYHEMLRSQLCLLLCIVVWSMEATTSGINCIFFSDAHIGAKCESKKKPSLFDSKELTTDDVFW